MDLTIREIKEKQNELESNINDLVNKFYLETKVKLSGEIKYGYTNPEHYVFLKYYNPFNS